ncbi:TauD/TfdA family dioxygenase [Sphingomonas bisphenolicum]|uniref:TauD/TfdA-like domain-containing protein n=1 Tax=Sphingomonas bisphenolicum TaxID=296544 RepID=A0ABN5WKY0_9SPHN|nr:TauD/TfdA family dioxygenase [Sphingomonas bisphenolicum]BBF70618.1 hypothetical protein SBA_ch1_28180 [Sphingomonas bisphenolicum]
MYVTISEEFIEKSADVPTLFRQIEEQGYAVLPGIATGRQTESVASDLGEPMAPWHDAVMQALTPRAASTPNTYSGIFGLGRFPFHTDLAHWSLPPRFLLLRCVRGYADVPTLLMDGHKIASAVGRDTMARALVKPRRRQHGELRMHRLLQAVDGGEVIRWDEVYLKPASPVGNQVSVRLQSLIDQSAPTPVAMIDDGDLLIIDNWRMLHARPAIAQNRRDRRLERVYLRSLK